MVNCTHGAAANLARLFPHVNTFYTIVSTTPLYITPSTLCLNGTFSWVDFMDVIMGDGLMAELLGDVLKQCDVCVVEARGAHPDLHTATASSITHFISIASDDNKT